MMIFITVTMMWTVKLFVCWMALNFCSGEENVELEIAQGKLIGLKNITIHLGVPFYSFRGIPYAKPNVGRDRFNVAVPLNNWSGVLNATKHGNICPMMQKKKVVGHEDCLFLNVYTPDLNETAGRAVMVFIHDGWLISGSGDDFIYGPDFLVEKDIVLVTINYRLDIIGFLNTGDASAPGNIGLKDQNLALKWVQKNIINFGGSPERVTIFGQGSGAAFVHYHMLSPMSQGLFKGAILQSGAAVSPLSFTHTPQENAMNFGKVMGINVTNTVELVEKLKDESTENLIRASQTNISLASVAIFTPSVEVNVGQDIFLSDDPWKIITTGEISDIPVMIGITENEVGMLTMKLASPLPQHRDTLADLIPRDLNITDPERQNIITASFEKFYFDGLPILANIFDGAELYNDVIINHGSLLSGEIMNARMKSPVYEYLFNFSTPYSILDHFATIIWGIVHGDDLGLLFYSPLLNNVPKLGSRDDQKINEMVEMWTNFAKEGDPSVTMEAAKIKWQPMGNDKKYLDIGRSLVMKNSLFKERVSFWANLYSDKLGEYIKLFN